MSMKIVRAPVVARQRDAVVEGFCKVGATRMKSGAGAEQLCLKRAAAGAAKQKHQDK